MMRRLHPEELIDEAKSLLGQSFGTSALRARAAAFLARQALEELLAEIWRKRAPGTENVSKRAQLICLPEYLRDEDLARRVVVAYWALSQACHHHAYELTPSISELRHWLADVTALAHKREVRGL
ncbi:MAG: hypothetical protein GY738_18365 [Pseudoalteromonas sp.]|nr:hypothetical protein [Pseudoalteromonas sp.]